MRVLVVSLTALLLLTCSNDTGCVGPSCSDPDYQPPECSFIDEPIVLDASDVVYALEVSDSTFVVDLSGIASLLGSYYNDFELVYEAGSTCPEDVSALNHNTLLRDRVSEFVDASPYACGAALTTHYRLFSIYAPDSVGAYVGPADEIYLSGIDIWDVGIRAMRIHDEFFAVPVPGKTPGIAFGDGSLWTCSRVARVIQSTSQWTYRVCEVSLSGEILSEFEVPDAHMFSGVEYRAGYVWGVSSEDVVYKLGPGGNVACQFPSPVGNTADIAYAAGSIWIAERFSRNGNNCSLYEVDVLRSCALRTAVVTDSISTPWDHCQALAWTGSTFLVVVDRTMYEMLRDGRVINSYELPVWNVYAADWDGSGIWILGDGPGGLGQVIARFKLR